VSPSTRSTGSEEPPLGVNDGTFPPGFVFGVATSAYQVEGGLENDWSEWERLGKLKDPRARCGRAVDHWNRFHEDLGLVKALGATALRISLEWARIEPTRGAIDGRSVEAYRERLLAMRSAGIRPVVTLHHFTHPSWFHRDTPWHSPESVAAFRAYAKVCAKILKGLDALVVVFNEPMVLLLGGYLSGLMPPGLNDGRKTIAAVEHFARAHVAAREELLAECGKVEIGLAQNVVAFAPDRLWHPVDHALCRLAEVNYNHAFIEGLVTGTLKLSMPGVASLKTKLPGKDGLDFVGVNYYTRAHLKFTMQRPFFHFGYRDVEKRGLTDLGWEDYPEGFSRLLLEMKRYRLPVWVTENGIDDRTGNRRAGYLHRHWKELLAAQRQGVDLRGYLHWALLDNFEWLEAWGPRFGLYRVDFDTLERTPTPACAYFRRVATTGQLFPPERTLEAPSTTLGATRTFG
jgi:beta-glucosidase